MDDLDLHLTQLFGWVVQTLGKAVLFATVVSGVLIVVGFMIEAEALVAFACVLAPIIFGAVLWSAEAPVPVEPTSGVDE